MAASDGEVNRLVLEIRRYLRAHPRAADNAEGIATWWVAGAQHGGPAAVESALQLLVGTGEMRAQALPDGRAVYAGAAVRRPGTHT